MKTVLFFFFSLISACSFGMDARELIRKMHDKLAAVENLEYHTVYELFKGHDSKEVAERYEGYVYKSGAKIYQKINTTEFVYSGDFSLKVNHSEEAMELSPAVKTTGLHNDIEQTLKVCSEIKLEEKGNRYILVFYFKNDPFYPYSLVKLTLSKKDFFPERIDYYYSDSQDFSKDPQKKEMKQPHLRVHFEKYKQDVKEQKELFELGKYIKQDGKQLIPLGVYKNYSIYDRRKK